MTTDAQPLEGGPPTRTDWAEEILRADILSGRLKPGERVKIGELVARYQGLSPTPLREALSRLAGSGLVEFLPQRGVSVAKISKKDLQDVYDIRILLEAIGLRRSLAKGDSEWKKEVQEGYEALRNAPHAESDASTSSEFRAWESAHRAFHFALLSRCGSPWLVRILGQLYEHSTRYRNLSLAAVAGSRDVLKEHERIAMAVLSGDSEGAVSALVDHLTLAVASLSESLD